MPSQIWIISIGRLFLQFGTGFILFYTTIFFVNVIGLPPALVGIAVGCQSFMGIGGRFLGGIFCDSQFWGRRGTLLLSAVISAFGAVGLAIADNLPLLIVANLFLGLGIGFYWPSIETIIADISPEDKRQESYAIATVADTIGLAIGTLLGGQIITQFGNYRILFILQGISFLVFFAIIYFAISEPDRPQYKSFDLQKDWLKVWRDRIFTIYILVNTFFIFYIDQIYSTLSLYVTNFAIVSETGNILNIQEISFFVTYYIVLSGICQVPIARILKRFNLFYGLKLAMIFWGCGFLILSLIGLIPQGTILLLLMVMTLFALGTVAHGCSAFALVAELAPPSLRGIYFSWSNQSWGIARSVGPVLGGSVMGFALQGNSAIAHFYWLAIATTTVLGFGILTYINGLIQKKSLLKGQ